MLLLKLKKKHLGTTFFTFFMNLQDVNSELQNSSSAPFRSNEGNCMQDQTCNVTVNEAKADVYLQGKGKIDATSLHFVGTGPDFSGMILPLNSSVQGIFSSWS